MKKNFSIISLFLLFTAFTQMDSGIEGKWKASMDTPNGEFVITYNFNVDGETLTGTVETMMGDTEILNGKVDGDTFSFETSFNGMTISHKCELTDENTIKMNFTMGGQGPQELTLTREMME